MGSRKGCMSMLSPKTKTSADRRLFSIIDGIKARREMNDSELAIVGHTTQATVSRDRKYPKRMTMERFIRYISPEIPEAEFVSAIEKLIIEKGAKNG